MSPPACGSARARWTSARSRCSGTASASASRSSTCSRCPPASACTRATSRSAASSRTSRPAGSEKVRAVHRRACPTRVDQYAALLDKNEIVLAAPARRRRRSTSETLLGLGVTGPLLRAAGNPWDLRKAAPYSLLRGLRLQDPGRHGRRQLRPLRASAWPRCDESVQDHRPGARRPARGRRTSPTTARYALPPRHELATSMEALIHHFKLVTEGFRVPPGEVYYPIESPRGELGCFVRSDGSSKPARVHMRDPSFVNLQASAPMVRGPLHRRPDRDARDARPGPRRDRPLMAIDPTPGHALRARLARPRLGRRRRPDEGPGGRPRPRDDAGARRRCAPRSRRYMAQVPGPPLGRDPGAARRPARARLVLADGDRAGRVRDAPDARLPDRGRDVLRHVRDAPDGPAPTSTCARTSRARCAAPTRCYARDAGRRRRRPGLQRARASSASARATSRRWPRSTASTSARSTLDDVPSDRATTSRRARAAARTSSSPARPQRRALEAAMR